MHGLEAVPVDVGEGAGAAVGAIEFAPPSSPAIRPCGPDDLVAVADLFQRNFRDRAAPAPASLVAYLRALYLDHPWYEPDLASRVHVDAAGDVTGFIGVLPLRLLHEGRPVRGAVAGSLMVKNPKASPLAGARLVRSFLAGPQDISISESANAVSVALWETLGHTPLLAYSMDWLRVLRPAGFVAAALRDRWRWAGPLTPVARLADAAVELARANALRPSGVAKVAVAEVDADEERFPATVSTLVEGRALRPAWDAESLAWFMAHARDKEAHGPAIRRVLLDRSGKPIGCYLYYGRAGGIAWAMQLLARPGAEGAVVDSLFRHAMDLGCAALRGRTDPRFVEAYLRRKCVLLRRAATIVHATRPELSRAVLDGDAMVTGLAGESWSRLIGGRFA